MPLLVLMTSVVLCAGTPLVDGAGEKDTDRLNSSIIRVLSRDVPISKTFLLKRGEALLLILPDNQEVAVWCRSQPPGRIQRLSNSEDLTLEYGEKPFRPLRMRDRPLAGGEGILSIVEEDSRAIRTGGCISYGRGRDYYFFAGAYRVSLHEDGVHDGVMPLLVHVRLATEEEREDHQLRGDEVITYFLPRLGAKQPAIRRRAIDKLVAYVEAEQLGGGIFRNGLHPSGHVIREAIGRLREDPDPGVRGRAQRALCELGDEVALLRFLRPLPPPDFRCVQGGIQVASWCRNGVGKEAPHCILPLLRADEEGLILFAVGFYARYEYKPGTGELLQLLAHPLPRVRLEVASELYKDREARKVIPSVLGKLMQEADVKLRLRAVEEAQRWRNELMEALIARLQDEDPSVRETAVAVLSGCRNPKVVGPLLAATRDASGRVRGEAAAALGRNGSEAAFARLVDLLADSSADARAGAAQGLRLLNQERGIPPLRLRLKEEKDEQVRRQIEQAIRVIVPPSP